MDSTGLLQTSARWLGLACSILTLLVGLIHLFGSKARIDWPPDQFFDDNNAKTWRDVIFSFRPGVFVDAWTPLVFGIVGGLAHIQDSMFAAVTADFTSYLIFNVIQVLFATIAYAGGLGIIFSIFGFIEMVLCLITLLLANDSASLDFEVAFKR